MDQKLILIFIIIACVVFIVVSLAKRKPERIINFGLRAIIGMAGIYLLNFLLNIGGLDIAVGVNGTTVLTNGLLGLPGFIMLYGLAIYYSLK